MTPAFLSIVADMKGEEVRQVPQGADFIVSLMSILAKTSSLELLTHFHLSSLELKCCILFSSDSLLKVTVFRKTSFKVCGLFGL